MAGTKTKKSPKSKKEKVTPAPDPQVGQATMDTLPPKITPKPKVVPTWVWGVIGAAVLVGAFILFPRGETPAAVDEPTQSPAPEEPSEPTKPPAQEEPTEPPDNIPPISSGPFECNDPLGCVEVAPDEDIHLAYMLTTSGPLAFLGEDSLGGIEIALADRGEVLGHNVNLTGEDSGCSPEGGQTAAAKVAADKSIAAVIGTTCSGSATAAMDTISPAGLLMCSPSNTFPALTNNGPGGAWQAGYFRTAHNDEFQGRLAAEFAYDILGARTAATIHDGSSYTNQLQEVFAAAFEELGGTITFQGSINVGDTDMRSVLTSTAAGRPDILFFPIFDPEGSFIVAQSSEFDGLENTVLMGADGMLISNFPGNAGQNSVGMYLSGPYLAGDAYDDFLIMWEEMIGGSPPSGYHAFAYDCTNMVLNAIEVSAQVDSDGSLLIGRQALRDAMTATAGYDGLTGTLSCSETGDCATGEALGIYQVTSADANSDWPFKLIWTPSKPLITEPQDGSVKACLVTDGGIDDRSFNATVWAGFELAENNLGAEIYYLESQQQTDYEAYINAFIAEDCDLIVTVGFLLGDATYAAAEANPDQKFAIVDYPNRSFVTGEDDLPNVVGLLFSVDQAAFLAGYVAADTTQTGKVATFGGFNVPPVTDFMNGFWYGVQYYNRQNGANVEVLGWDLAFQEGLFTGNFESIDDGRAFADNLMDEGADVIMPIAGPVGLGSAAAIQERSGVWLIGVDTDWTISAPEYADIILTSVLKNMNTAVYDQIGDVFGNTFPTSINYFGTLENGGVGITNDKLNSDLVAVLDELIEGILAGDIKTTP